MRTLKRSTKNIFAPQRTQQTKKDINIVTLMRIRYSQRIKHQLRQKRNLLRLDQLPLSQNHHTPIIVVLDQMRNTTRKKG